MNRKKQHFKNFYINELELIISKFISIFRKKLNFLTNSTITFYLIIICLFFFTNEIHALNVTASSCNYNDVLSAIKDVQSAGGGTVNLPAGTSDWWVNDIEFPSGINIIGAGIGKTNLRTQIDRVFVVNKYPTNEKPCRISGISFEGYDPNTSHTAQNCLNLFCVQNFRIDNCHLQGFKYVINFSMSVQSGYAPSKGVVDHCIIERGNTNFRSICGVCAGKRPWKANMKMGTDDAIFIEDCTFVECSHPAASFGGGHYVLRYCNIINSGAIDVHGPDFDDSKLGTICCEIYNNKIYRTNDFNRGLFAIGLRARGGVIFNNTIQRYQYGVRFTIDTPATGRKRGLACSSCSESDCYLLGDKCFISDENCYRFDAGAYACSNCDQTNCFSLSIPYTYPSLDQIHDMWVWNNTLIDVDSSDILLFQNDAETMIKENRDYFLRPPSQELDGFTYTPFTYPHPLNIPSPVTYYVAKDGNDKNDGSELQPWLAIQKAANTAVAGDTVYIKEGIYNEKVIFQESGVSGNFITYKAYPGHIPIIDGQSSGTIFSIVGKDYIKIDGLEIKNAGQWGILVENSTNIEIKNTKVSYSNNCENIQIRGSSSFILIEGCEASYAQKRSGIDIYQYNGRPHHVTVKNCIAHHNENFAGIASEQADNLIIENNTSYNNSLGIDIGSGDNNIINDNIVHDCSTGIALSSNEDSQVYDNLIYNIVDEAIYSYYWIKHGEAHARNKWHNNIIYSAGFGIYESVRKNANYDIGPSSDHEYYNNLFYNIGTHGSFRVPFYFQGPTGIKFYNNTIYMNANYDALQFIDDAKGSEIKNNIISINGNKFALRIEDTSYINAKVNYNFYENKNGTSIILWNNGTGIKNYTISQVNDKTFYNNTGQGEHSITGDPKFIDPTANDFKLQALSPCIDAGDPKYSVPSGGGLRIDMGAFEFIANKITLIEPRA